jgi:ankyrin repeat protein
MKQKLLLLATVVLAFALGVFTHSSVAKRATRVAQETNVQGKVHRCTSDYYNQSESYETFDAYCFGLQAKLYHEAWAGNVEVMKRLLRDGANPGSYSEQFLPPLLTAAGNGHTEAVRLLLDNGADINRAWTVGSTPLMWAVGNGHTETVKLLVSRGANVNVRTHEGATALEVARNGKHQDIVELLKQAGAK